MPLSSRRRKEEKMVLVEMTEEEAVRRWLMENGFCAIRWSDVQVLSEHYNKTKGNMRACVFHAGAKPTPTYRVENGS
jgi:hypothetical protein